MILFAVIVASLLLVDIAVLPRLRQGSPVRIAILWTILLALLAASYAVYLGLHSGRDAGFEFASGYLIEFSLSVDNLFVFLLLFRSLQLTTQQQHRVLLWGILGAILLRALFIVVGLRLLERFAWVQYLFGAILLIAALRLLRPHRKKQQPSGIARWLSRRGLRFTGDHRLALSSLLIVILAVELTDLVFALDSIPAVLAVTRSPMIAWTSNVFAILGLRSLYFALSGLLDRFRLLHYGLGLILAFVAFKMIAAHWIAIPTLASLGIILGILALFSALSLRQPSRP
ncbi:MULTISPECIES: TerC/Alx family metal homeostasis membrane protein [Acidobacterium]|uniref:Membrane protein, TerC family n=1 Tax=Acidobacterium capsulatum (strain ATCC 51196 / DSM 11244 / BCRC 80197 / JCM 7670 / NBRC 15755 / NCIMB 13165 / 161) TaxID=240015 RepID=C1F430_ACIC5|nr:MULTISPECIES: TerC/Alx family metal homeostasis membrane protein [Acidobacterium]ACO32260.1 membrane protein, TerC family [Acidobacterium capsulatum ATCC 51196]HCT60289.1 branched-chain amino acid ABC transporter substrate-binding protein [Acidobacterium sp.]